MQVLLKRYYTKNGDGATLGYFTTQDKEAINFDPICYTLERPLFHKGVSNKRDDKKTPINESCCIPIGKYKVKKTFSPKFQTDLFLVLNVEGRDGIRIHQANWMQQLHGCIAPVDWIINDKTKIFTGLNSAESLQALNKFIGGNEFTLTIIDNEQELVKQKLLIKNKNLVL
jgi:hypothetical protein